MTDPIGGPPTPADLESAAAVVIAAEWGRHPSSVRRVSSDVEETFLIAFPTADTDRPARAVLKIAEPGRDREWFEFEALAVEQALLHDPGLPLARGILTPDGRSIVTTAFLGGSRPARLMQELEGVASHTTRPDAAARCRIGRTAGRLSRALSSVEHPVARRRVPWDLRGLGALADALPLVPDRRARADVERVLGAHPALLRTADLLPAQLSHNDLNGGNILVAADDPGSVTGIIDFGDAALTPRIFDLGIAAAYAAAEASSAPDGTSPWSSAASFAAGYLDEVALSSAEIALVPSLARARLAQRVLIAAARLQAAAPVPTRDDAAWLAAAQRDLRAIMETSPTDSVDAPKEWQ